MSNLMDIEGVPSLVTDVWEEGESEESPSSSDGKDCSEDVCVCVNVFAFSIITALIYSIANV